MTIHPITVPQWGFAMESGVVAGWHVAPGDTLNEGDEVVDLETTKIANVVESPVSGTVRRLVGQDGEDLPVGALLAVVTDDGETDAAVDDFVVAFQEKFAAEGPALAAGPEPEFADIDGRPIRFLRSGAESGTPIILVHGFGGDLDNFMFNRNELGAEHPLIALDLPGHGESGKDVGSGDLAMLAGALGGLIDHLGLGSAHIVAHSMGAAVAAKLAQARPEAFASLATICGACYGTAVSGAYLDGFITARRRKDLKPVAEMLFADTALVTRSMLEDLLIYKRKDGVTDALTAIRNAVFADDRAPDYGAALAALPVPVTAIWGTADAVVTPPETLPEALAAKPLPDAGHMAHMEAAAAVNEALLAHINSAD